MSEVVRGSWGSHIATEIPPDGPTAEQIRFARWVIRHIPYVAPSEADYFNMDDPRAWDDLKMYLRRAEAEAETRPAFSP